MVSVCDFFVWYVLCTYQRLWMALLDSCFAHFRLGEDCMGAVGLMTGTCLEPWWTCVGLTTRTCLKDVWASRFMPHTYQKFMTVLVSGGFMLMALRGSCCIFVRSQFLQDWCFVEVCDAQWGSFHDDHLSWSSGIVRALLYCTLIMDLVSFQKINIHAAYLHAQQRLG